MNKKTFLAQLRTGLAGLPEEDIAQRLTFYSEIIDDRMDEGLSEEEAVCAVGTVPEIVAQIAAEMPSAKTTKQTKKPRKTWQVVLIVLGSPVWFSLAVAAVAVILSLYVSVWAVIISLWAVFGSLVGCGIGGILGGIAVACTGSGTEAMVLLGAGLICTGLSVFLFYACNGATKGVALLTKKTAVWIKTGFTKKEEA